MLLALVTYLLVAPFDCEPSGSCEGLVAFEYQPDSAGHWQAIGAGALLGSIMSLFVWLVIAPRNRLHTVARAVATPLLVAGIVVSLFSHGILIVVGPVVGGLVLWLMWSPRGTRQRDFSGSGPFYSRR